MLSKKNLHDLIETTLLNIKLTGAVIEKDYYVTQVIHALSDIQNEYFRLVFAGGTCLAKAHRIVDRMSEDIDFKIQMKNNENFSRSRLIKELKEFRIQIKSSLVVPGLATIKDVARNEGKYQRVILKYPYTYPISSTLRPDLLLEFTLSDIRLSVEDLSVKTIIEEVLKEMSLFKSPQTPCISVDETAIEKWVGLTRRVIAIERNYHTDDNSLVRHIYDLNSIKKANMINDNFFTLAKTIVISDAKQFKNQHPEYAVNPGDEIRESLDLLKNKPIWKENYQKFLAEMVYDASAATEYEKAITTIESISTKVLDLLPDT
jgi:predicted nucleotidyltransferase component of viral defense system